MRRFLFLFCTLCVVVPLGLQPTATPAATAELEVYLPLDGNTLDASGHGRDGVLTDGPAGTNAYVGGQVGQGIQFGLTAGNTVENAETTWTGNDFITVAYTLPEAGTIALWKKTAEIRYSFQSFWDNSGAPGSFLDGADNWECWMNNSSRGKLYARAPDGEDGRWDDLDNRSVYVELRDIYGASPAFLDIWTHVTVTWEKLTETSMEMNMYIDGSWVDTASAMVWQNPGDLFYLAGGNPGNTAGIGVWDELAIWSGKLDDAQVLDVYQNGVLLPGDANADGTVDLLDLGIVGDNWNLTGKNWTTGDFTGDGTVDLLDLGIVGDNWNSVSTVYSEGTPPGAVPEPSTLALLLGILASLAYMRRKR